MKKIGPQGLLLKIIDFLGYWNATFLFQSLRITYLTLDRVLDWLCGYSLVNGSKVERENANTDFDHAAHYVDILGRFTHDVFTGEHLHRYIVKHKRYGNPLDVLNNDRVIIQGVTHLQAWFCHSSLGTKIKLTTLSMKHYKGFLRSNNANTLSSTTF